MIWKNKLKEIPALVILIVLISVGIGTASAIITITLEGIVIFPEPIHILSNLYDSSGDSGTEGQVLSSTPTGVDWISVNNQGTLSVIHRESNSLVIQSGQSGTVIASCLQGEVVTGGGFQNISLTGAPLIDYDGPQLTNNLITGWKISIFNDGFDSMSVKAFVICEKLV